MIQTRRQMIQSVLWAIPAAAAPARLLAEDDYDDVSGPFPATFRLFGTKPALGPEEDEARRILTAVPAGLPLLETARHFEELERVNGDGHRYNAQWPKRWNPVIVGFYQSTSLAKPYVFQRGDTIPWCAAFLNWCLIRGGYAFTGSASSGSFRLKKGLGAPTTDPVPGDLAVFRHGDPAKAAAGLGHVGIFVGHAKGGLLVLGGNQRAGKRFSSVNTTFFPDSQPSLVLDSFRSLASIRKSHA